jgi:hypothetical protein
MKSIEIFIVCVVTIIGALTRLNWKKDKTKKKMLLIFVFTTIIGALIIAYNRFFIDDKAIDESHNYLLKNRAKIVSLLYIDNIKRDSISYHLKMKNLNPLAAQNIRYVITINDEYDAVDQGEESEIGENESHLIYPASGNVIPVALNDGTLSLQFFIYYISIWQEDTLQHKENFVFFVPSGQIGIKEYEPITKLTDKVLDKKEIDSITIAEQLKKNEGTAYFVVFKKELNKPICYIFNTDSAALLYQTEKQDLIFQKLFANGESLQIKKHLEPDKSKGYIITLAWSEDKYTLQVNKEPEVTVYRRKN